VGSSYCLEVQDAASAVLHSQCFDLAFFDYEAGEASPIDAFLTALPRATGAGRVVLKKGAVVLGQVTASAHAPQVTLLSPTTTGPKSGRIPIQWTASDADPGSELAFNLSYSHDNGATWRPFALNVTGTQALELDLSNVPGGAACRVKVYVSDGWHNASDASDVSFQVADKAPLAGILWPEDGATVQPPLALQGYGYDLEDGQQTGAALSWSSDVDGALGSGDTVWDVDLTPGVHTLTLRVIDSKSHTGSASVVVTVTGGLPGGERVYLPIVLRQH